VSYLVLARKWRPQTFSDLIGQEHVSQTLKNAIDSGRVAHAFLFTGARGVGKTSSARILAKTLNCENGPTTEPCNTCAACREITEGNSVDVFEIDGASNNGVDEIRDLRDNVKYLPSHSRYKIFIIDEVHMLSTSAFNALLKTLEEPPPHIKFIFATTEPHKVPITILSRCQRFDFKRIPLAMIIARLRFIVDQEGVGISDSALTMIARKGDGSMRDSLSALDQVLAFCGETVADADVIDILGVVDRQMLLSAINAVFARDTATVLRIVAQVDSAGYNMRVFCSEMIDLMRVLLLLSSAPDSSELLDLSDRELAECSTLAQSCDVVTLQRFIAILLRTDSDMAHTSFSRLLLEMAMIKMATISPVIPVHELLDRLKTLESRSPSIPVAGEPATLPYRPAPPENKPVSKPANGPAIVPLATPPQPLAVPPAAPATPDWQGFVAYVKALKPMLASKLEKGSPLQVGSDSLQLGYPKGTLELSMLQEADYQQQLAEFATAFYGKQVQVKVVPLSGNEESIPLSIAEKKTAEITRNENRMKAAADSHPMVVAALEIFGGEIVAYKQKI
jgi:DNA polymerase-3 subunit gamma/tau